jgi:hypothetical protein
MTGPTDICGRRMRAEEPAQAVVNGAAVERGLAPNFNTLRSRNHDEEVQLRPVTRIQRFLSLTEQHWERGLSIQLMCQ